MVTTTTPWSTATAHLSHCKAQTETFVLICHMPMFQEKLSNPFTLFTFIIIVYQILNFYFSLKWTFPLNIDFVRNFLFIIVFLTFVFVYLTKWILNLNIEFRISSFLWSRPLTMFSGCSLIALFAAFSLPETLGDWGPPTYSVPVNVLGRPGNKSIRTIIKIIHKEM